VVEVDADTGFVKINESDLNTYFDHFL